MTGRPRSWKDFTLDLFGGLVGLIVGIAVPMLYIMHCLTRGGLLWRVDQ